MREINYAFGNFGFRHERSRPYGCGREMSVRTRVEKVSMFAVHILSRVTPPFLRWSKAAPTRKRSGLQLNKSNKQTHSSEKGTLSWQLQLATLNHYAEDRLRAAYNPRIARVFWTK